MVLFHPWRRLRARPEIDLVWSRDPVAIGLTDGRHRVTIHPDQLQAERRCTLTHELAHIHLGHTNGCANRGEEAAKRLAARWLIDFSALLDALAWTDDLAEAADELWVDEPTLRARLRGLSELERAALTRKAREMGELR